MKGVLIFSTLLAWITSHNWKGQAVSQLRKTGNNTVINVSSHLLGRLAQDFLFIGSQKEAKWTSMSTFCEEIRPWSRHHTATGFYSHLVTPWAAAMHTTMRRSLNSFIPKTFKVFWVSKRFTDCHKFLRSTPQSNLHTASKHNSYANLVFFNRPLERHFWCNEQRSILNAERCERKWQFGCKLFAAPGQQMLTSKRFKTREHQLIILWWFLIRKTILREFIVRLAKGPNPALLSVLLSSRQRFKENSFSSCSVSPPFTRASGSGIEREWVG